jgi:hypothetical protein
VDAKEALAVLGLSEETDLARARAAYHDRVRAWHPDVAPGDEGAHARTARLTEAYEIVVAHLHDRPAAGPAAAPPPGPPRPEATPAPPTGDRGVSDALLADVHDEGSIAVAAPADETFAALWEAAGRVGHIAYYDRHLAILEIIVRFEGGPSCSVVMTLQGRTQYTEVLCTMESIESAPTPAIGPVLDALVAELRSL